MKFFIPMMLIVTMFASSCSTYIDSNVESERSLASDPVSPLTLDELLTIKTTTEIGEETDIIGNIKARMSFISYQFGDIEIVEDPKMDSSKAYRILPVIENQNYKVKIFYSQIAKKDSSAYEELIRTLEHLFNKNFMHSASVHELYFNMKAGDFTSLEIMAKIRALSAIPAQGMPVTPLDTEKAAYWSEVIKKFEKEDRVNNKKIKVQETARKAVMDALDKVSDDQQFRTLVARNDRKGAANLLKSYLPWELMAPFEKQFWETHLKLMADPLPLEDRVLVYRGINDDIIQVADTGGKALSREEAIKEQKIFLMSTMMTKNQGSWNRRLRSLTAMNEKFMGTNYSNSSEFTRAARITNMFKKHASAPQGSPFLSYTPDFNVAAGFGTKRNTAYLLDPRMIYFNYASGFKNEIEFLLPLVSFPDELVGVWDLAFHVETHPSAKNFFNQQLAAKLVKKFGKEKAPAALEKILVHTNSYFAPAIQKSTDGPKGGLIEEKSMDLLKSLHGISSKEASVILNQDTEMKCADLIKVFWN